MSPLLKCLIPGYFFSSSSASEPLPPAGGPYNTTQRSVFLLCIVTKHSGSRNAVLLPVFSQLLYLCHSVVSVLRYLFLWLCYYGFDTLPCSVCLYYLAIMSDPRTFRHYSKTPWWGGMHTGNDESAAFSCCYLKHGHGELAEVDAAKVDAAWRRRRAEADGSNTTE